MALAGRNGDQDGREGCEANKGHLGARPYLVQLVLEHFQLRQIQLADINRLRHVGKEGGLGERKRLSSQPLSISMTTSRGLAAQTSLWSTPEGGLPEPL